MNTVQLVTGDPSADGHGKTETILVKTNLSAALLQKAYKKGSKVVGFDFNGNVATDYEDSVIPERYLDSLKHFNLLDEELASELNEGDDYYLDGPEEFASIWLGIAKLGNPALEYEIVEPDYENQIEIGGYGLFNG